MLINLEALFNKEVPELKVSFDSTLTFHDRKVLIKASGKIEALSQAVFLNVSAEYEVDSLCSRCLNNIKRKGSMSISRPIVLRDEAGGNDDYLILDDYYVDVEKYVEEELILSFSITELCDENCKGLCPSCGINLNFENCNCITREVDPRLEVLRTLLD